MSFCSPRRPQLLGPLSLLQLEQPGAKQAHGGALFCAWERSFWHWTTIPVGTW